MNFSSAWPVSGRQVSGMLSGAGSVMLKAALSLIVVPVFVATLGLEVFGLNALLLSLLEIALLLDLGASGALVRVLSASRNADRKKACLEIGHLFFAVIAALFLLIGLALAQGFADTFHIAPSLRGLIAWGLPLTLMEGALGIYGCFHQAVLLSHCEHRWTHLADSLYAVLSGAGSAALLLCGVDLTALIAWRLFSALVRFIVMLAQAKRLEPTLFQIRTPLRRKRLKALAGLWGHAFTINLGIIVSHKLDTMIIARFLPLASVGIYDMVMRMLGVILQIGLKLSVGAFPLFSAMAARQARPEAKRLFLRLSGLLNLSAGVLLLFVVIFHPALIGLFSAHRVSAPQILPVLALMIPCALSGVLQLPANSWLFTWGHQAYLTRSSLMAAMANLTLSLLLTPVLGLIGVALGTLIPQVIQHQMGLIRTTCRHLRISAITYLREVHGRALLPLCAAGLTMILARALMPVSATPWMLLPLLGMAGLAAVLVGFGVRFALTDSGKALLRGIFLRVFRRNASPCPESPCPASPWPEPPWPGRRMSESDGEAVS